MLAVKLHVYEGEDVPRRAIYYVLTKGGPERGLQAQSSLNVGHASCSPGPLVLAKRRTLQQASLVLASLS